MSEPQTDEPHERDAEPPQGFEHPPVPRMPPATLRVRLRTSPAIRTVLPSRLVVARAERKARRLWREHEASHAYAVRTMEAVVAGTPREADLEEIAERHLVEIEAWEALFWQPWSAPHVDARSRALLQGTCAGERGVLLSACHLGPYFPKAKTLVTLGIEPYVVTGDFFLEEPSNDYWGRRLARWRRGVPDVPLVRPRGSFAVLAGALERRETVLVYFDMPGPHETRFLGKPAMLADGTARLAVETDALVLPVRSWRRGHRLALDAHEPLDPRSFAGVDDLHEALAALHERLILEQPEAMADPADYGWGDGATAQRWDRPSQSHDRDIVG
jgi:lauroyl/myristoyl acyltransferase